MPTATKNQIEQLQHDHWDLFLELVKGANFRVNLARQYGLGSKEFLDFNKKYVPIVHSWIKRELELEYLFKRNTGLDGMFFSGDLSADDFFVSASLPKLQVMINNAGRYYPNNVV